MCCITYPLILQLSASANSSFSCGKLDNINSVLVWLYTDNWSEGPQSPFFFLNVWFLINPLGRVTESPHCCHYELADYTEDNEEIPHPTSSCIY